MSKDAAQRTQVAVADHLVVAARTLDEAAAWCERTLGVVSQPGGRHVGVGTHNRLIGLAGGAFPRTYLELIAIDPDAPGPLSPRWFDLDDAALAAAIANGPRLVHWVARTDDLDAACAALRAAGHDVGPVVAAGRDTPAGPLSWRITRPLDGSRPACGAVPLLIAWGDRHPCDDLAPSPLSIERITIGGVSAAASDLLGATLDVDPGAPPLAVRLSTPRGPLDLASP